MARQETVKVFDRGQSFRSEPIAELQWCEAAADVKAGLADWGNVKGLRVIRRIDGPYHCQANRLILDQTHCVPVFRRFPSIGCAATEFCVNSAII